MNIERIFEIRQAIVDEANRMEFHCCELSITFPKTDIGIVVQLSRMNVYTKKTIPSHVVDGFNSASLIASKTVSELLGALKIHEEINKTLTGRYTQIKQKKLKVKEISPFFTPTIANQ